MRTLIESTFVTLGGDIAAPQEWGWPYLNCPDGNALNRELLFGADALVLGRKTYEGLSAAYHKLKGLGGLVRVWNVTIARGIEQMDRLRFESIAPTFLLAITKRMESDD